ncbi:MAG: hypothetical protein VX936_02405, partial [Planctomycetota bacterium]|nr:hypothetical protein [Planctomycetota bacterium]
MTTTSPEQGDSLSDAETERVDVQHNVGWLLTRTAQTRPDQLGIAFPKGRSPDGKRQYQMLSFKELDEDSDRIAAGLLE